MAQFGTNTTYDLLASRFQYANMDLSVSAFGEQYAADGIQVMLNAHNAQLMDIMGDMLGTTRERLLMYGTGDLGQMIELDELGTPQPQKQRFGSIVGFPLQKFGGSWQGTRQYFKKATVGELIGQARSMMDADRRNLINQFRKAIYNPVNYTFTDDLVDHLTATPIPVKRLANADGQALPPGPNGETFNPNTHNHYLGVTTASTPVAGDVVATYRTVFEHYSGGPAIIAINSGNQSAIAAMTPNFVAMLPTMILGSIQANQAPGSPLDVVPINNRQIGFFDGVPVWIKPWAPLNILTVTIRGDKKVCLIRTDPDSNTGGELVLDYKDENYPLRAEYYQREFGIAVYERVGAAVLDLVNQTYSAPTLASY